MTLDAFLTKNEVELSPLTKTFCEEGIERMRSSIDPAHNVGGTIEVAIVEDPFGNHIGFITGA